MKLAALAVLSVLLVSGLFAVRNHAASRRVQIAGPAEDLNFGPLENAPNGHLSFQKNPNGFRLWVPGKLQLTSDTHEEGGFLFDIPDWTADALKQAQPTFGLGHFVDENNPDCGAYVFDRNYAAMNAVVPGAEQGTLLAFYDAEYHVACKDEASEPLLSSIGIATSIDGGVTWQNRNQIIQGLDEATLTAATVTHLQYCAFKEQTSRVIDCGASGPSVVERYAEGAVYLYLYYADRTPLTGGRDSIYVARALVASDGQPGNWEKWNGTAWGATGDQTGASPIVRPPAGAVLALQPHVSWNTALHSWLMVFKTANDFEVSASADGVNWETPVSLLPVDDQLFGFPTLVSVNGGACDGCADRNDQNPSSLLNSRNEASQQVTGANGYLYYSSVPANKHHYVGHRLPFRISANNQ
ncbi:MAG TPA: hypothetical protein VE961_07040 [Pyrinomonadaceae bacterium]|nr:hypothetical protein [Pyrinomonadaceae bacterium]